MDEFYFDLSDAVAIELHEKVSGYSRDDVPAEWWGPICEVVSILDFAFFVSGFNEGNGPYPLTRKQAQVLLDPSLWEDLDDSEYQTFAHQYREAFGALSR